MSAPIDPAGIWYHGSPLELSELRTGSTVTQWRALAEAFSHKPTCLGYETYGDGGSIIHNGTAPGWLYVVDEPVALDADVYPHPRTTMDENAEFLTRRPLKLRRVAGLPKPGWRIRPARPEDAPQLFLLNQRFNGPSLTTVEAVARSLGENSQETAFLGEAEGQPAGFLCVQALRSFCYERPTAQVTELFVREEFRRQGLALEMLRFGEAYCRDAWGAEEFSLLTGKDNLPAQSLYRKAGYTPEDELLFAKSIQEVSP